MKKLKRFPHSEFYKPGDVVKDSQLSESEKKMAPENDHVAEHEPKLDEVVKAQQRLGKKPQNKPTQ